MILGPDPDYQSLGLSLPITAKAIMLEPQVLDRLIHLVFDLAIKGS